MPNSEKPGEVADWSLATWNGSRREALRRWAQLPLEQVIAALEEMQAWSDMFSSAPAMENTAREPRADYRTGPETSPASAPTADRGSHRLDEKDSPEG